MATQEEPPFVHPYDAAKQAAAIKYLQKVSGLEAFAEAKEKALLCLGLSVGEVAVDIGSGLCVDALAMAQQVGTTGHVQG